MERGVAVTQNLVSIAITVVKAISRQPFTMRQ